MNNNEWVCTCCGAEDVELTVIDDMNHVCDECLEENYFFCEECEEYWLYDDVESFETEDGRTVCENCAEDLE